MRLVTLNLEGQHNSHGEYCLLIVYTKNGAFYVSIMARYHLVFCLFNVKKLAFIYAVGSSFFSKSPESLKIDWET